MSTGCPLGDILRKQYEAEIDHLVKNELPLLTLNIMALGIYNHFPCKIVIFKIIKVNHPSAKTRSSMP